MTSTPMSVGRCLTQMTLILHLEIVSFSRMPRDTQNSNSSESLALVSCLEQAWIWKFFQKLGFGDLDL